MGVVYFMCLSSRVGYDISGIRNKIDLTRAGLTHYGLRFFFKHGLKFREATSQKKLGIMNK